MVIIIQHQTHGPSQRLLIRNRVERQAERVGPEPGGTIATVHQGMVLTVRIVCDNILPIQNTCS